MISDWLRDMKEKYIVLGAGGHAKVALDILKLNKKNIYGLTDANILKDSMCMGYPIIGTDEELERLIKSGVKNAVMGIGHVGDVTIRDRVYLYAKQLGFEFPNIIHPRAIVAENVMLGKGNLISAQAILNPEACIGTLCIINTASVIEHDVCIGDGVHVAPHATVLGMVNIGDNSFIGAGSVILQGVTVGRNCIIGAGTVVLNDVPDNSVVVGNPGIVRKRR